MTAPGASESVEDRIAQVAAWCYMDMPSDSVVAHRECVARITALVADAVRAETENLTAQVIALATERDMMETVVKAAHHHVSVVCGIGDFATQDDAARSGADLHRALQEFQDAIRARRTEAT